MPLKNNVIAVLSDPAYVPVIKDNNTSYGGSQMWFASHPRYRKDYILHNYGCGTIAVADLFLYLARQNEAMHTSTTGMAMVNHEILYPDYISYIRLIHDRYTKTLPILAVLGPVAAGAINAYSDIYTLGLRALWKLSLSYYDMYELMEEMLQQDLPVILSIGPNTPKLWGKKGIPLYELCEINYISSENNKENTIKPYYYKAVKSDVNGHYVTVTGLFKDEVTGKIMLRISSWGKQYFINYEEYRDYIETTGGTFTSSMVYTKKIRK